METPQQTLGQFDQQTDIGSISHPGSCQYDAGAQSYTITGSGANIWGDHDDFHFVYKTLRGDFIVTARARFVGAGVEAHRKFGWMVRATLDTASPHITTAVHGDGLTSLQFRRSLGGRTQQVISPGTQVDVIQLERKGNTYTMSVARFGEPFVTTQVADLALGDEVFVGLAVCSHNDAVSEAVLFDNVRIVVPVADNYVRSRDPLGSLLEVLDVESGQREVVYQADDIFEAPNWTPNGKALIFNRGGRLYRFDLTERVPVLIDTEPVVHNNNDHVISFDGKMLAISSSSAEDRASIIYTVPITGGSPKRITPQGPSYLHGWSPDGQYLVYTARRNGDFDIYRIPAEGGEEVQLTNVPGLDDGPEYSPDGQYIYFNSVRSGTMQIWRMKPDGSDPEQVTGDQFNNWFPHISPDGRLIVFISYTQEVAPSDHPPAKRVYLQLMPVNNGGPRVSAYLYGGQGTINVPSWSPDSKRIAFVSNTVP